MPWAFLVACVLALAAEVAVRMLPFERTTPYAWGLGEYDASALRLRTEGPPEVLVLGTSRAREGLDLPRMRAMLAGALGRDVRVGNHGLSGARAGEAEAVLDLALREGRPRLVMLGIDPRLFQGEHEHTDRQARFAPLRASWSGDGTPRDRRIAAHANLGALLRTYGCRVRLGAALRGADDLAPRPTPLAGGPTLFQREQPDRSLVTHPIDDAWIDAILARVREGGRYDLQPTRYAAVERMLRACTTREIPVLLFEVPLSRALERHLPLGTLEATRGAARRLAAEHGTGLVLREDLDALFDEDDFFEPSHLALPGARALTEALVRDHLLPRYAEALR